MENDEKKIIAIRKEGDYILRPSEEYVYNGEALIILVKGQSNGSNSKN